MTHDIDTASHHAPRLSRRRRALFAGFISLGSVVASVFPVSSATTPSPTSDWQQPPIVDLPTTYQKPLSPPADARGAAPNPQLPANEQSWTALTHVVKGRASDTAQLFAAPLFRPGGEENRWQAVDPWIGAGTAGSVVSSPGQVVPVRLGSAPAAAVALDAPGGTIGFGLAGVAGTTASPTVDGVAYTGGPLAQVTTHVTRQGVHLDIARTAGNAPVRLALSVDDAAHQLGAASLQADGSIAFAKALNGASVTVAAAMGGGSNAARRALGGVTLGVTGTATGDSITITVPPAAGATPLAPSTVGIDLIFTPRGQGASGTMTLAGDGCAACATSPGDLVVAAQPDAVDGARIQRGMLGIDTSVLPGTAIIDSAKLTAHVTACSGAACTSGADVEVHAMTGAVGPETTAANAAALTAGGAVTTQHVAAGAQSVTWDVTSLVQRWVDGVAPNDGVSLQAAAEHDLGGGFTFAGPQSSDASLVPELDVTYHIASLGDNDVAAPAPPSRVSVTAGSGSALVSWTPPATVPGVPIVSSLVTLTDTDSNTSQTALVHDSSAWFFGLTPGHALSASVWAQTAGARSATPATASATVPVATPSTLAPGVPASPVASSGSAGVDVRWAPPAASSAVSRYDVVGYDAGGTPVASVVACAACTSTVLRSTGPAIASVGISASNNYGATSAEGRVSVAASSAVAASPVPSGVAPAAASIAAGGVAITQLPDTTGPTVPGAPGSVTGTPGNTNATISWTAASDGGATITGYTVQAYTSTGTAVGSAVTVCGTCLSATVSGLTNGSSYYATVYATNSVGNGPTAQSNTFTLNAPPSVQKYSRTLATDNSIPYSRGVEIGFGLKVFNPQTTTMSVSSASDALDSGYVPELNLTLNSTDFVNGPFCTPTSTPSCTLPGDGTMTMGAFTLAAGASVILRYYTVVIGSERGCAYDRTAFSATNAYGTGTDSSQAPILCDAGLGDYSWFTTTSFPTGPGGSLALNVGDGNALVSQDDSTAVPLHGDLTLGLHRAYNSIALSSASGAGMLGSAWWLTFDDGGAVAQGLTAAGIFLPTDESVARPLPVTVVTADGGRTVFPLVKLATPIDVTALQNANSTGPLAVTIPRALALDTGYNRICVDQLAGPPMGVHASLWRYVEANSSNSTCTASTWTSSAILGYAVERVDRVRYEFAGDGHKLDTQDANGNEIRVHYVNDPPSAGKAMGNLSSVVEPATGRSLTFTYTTGTPNNEMDVTDVAHRVTKYFTNATSGLLVSVTNPDATQLLYTYGGCTASSSTQLCSMSSPLGSSTTTRLTYTQTSSNGTTYLGPAQVASVTDRRGTVSTFSYNTSTGAATLSEPGQNRVWSSFDPFDDAGALNVVDPASGQTVTQTFFFWDNTYGGNCRKPDNLPDHNLCSTVAQNLAGNSDTRYTRFRYGSEGQLIRVQNCTAMTDFTSRGSGHDCTGSYLYTSYGSHAIYVDASGSTAAYDDMPSGGGQLTDASGPGSGGVRWTATTLYAVVDGTQSLPPRGNVGGLTTAQWQAYLTTKSVDNSASFAPNQRGASGVCGNPSTPTGNTGDVCQVLAPAYSGTNATRTRMTYLRTGEVATRSTPETVGYHYGDVVRGTTPGDYWPLSDVAGSTSTRDVVSTTTTASASSVTFGVAGPFSDGVTAASFNGSSSVLTGGTTSYGTVMSMEAWISPQSNAQAMTPIAKIGSGTWQTAGTYGFGVSGNGASLLFYQYPNGGTQGALTATGLNLVGGWHHVAATDDGATLNIYVDGVKRATGAAGSQCSGTSCLNGGSLFGGGSSASSMWFQGSMAHLAMYGKALTQTQVTAHAGAGVADAAHLSYVYYQDTDHDLSGNTVAGGWLKATVDPSGNFAAYAYDAAGNAARIWDQDATTGMDVPSFPGTVSAPTASTYTEQLHATGAGAYSAPGRFVVSKRDQLGNLTTYTLDADGNHTAIRPPLGNQAGNASYDVTQAFDAGDNLVCSIQPVEAAGTTCNASGTRINGATQTVYDARGNATQATDPVGNVATVTFDAANRRTKTTWIRGWNYTDTRSPYYGASFPAPTPANCPVLSAADGPFPAGSVECSARITYDGTGYVAATTDGDGGQVQNTYDPQGHVLSKLVERAASPLTWERTDNVYDEDGNVTRTCPPSSFANGTTSCATSTSAYDTAHTYDVNDRLATTVTCRSACQSPTLYTTTFGYDADGNQVSVADPRGVTTTTAFGLTDRKMSSSYTRSGTPITTLLWYSAAGDVLDVVDPSGKVTATSYDADHRKVDVVDGADSISAALAGTLAANGGQNVRTRTFYDADSNVIEVLQPQAFTSLTSPDTRFQGRSDYDADGRVVATWTPYSDSNDSSKRDPSSTGQCPTGAANYPSTVGVCVTRYQYDGDGHVTSTLLPTAAGNWASARHVDAAYTSDGYKASETSPSPTGSGMVKTFAFYDASGRTVKTLDAIGTPDATAYSPDGLVIQHSAEPAQHNTNGTWVTDVWHCETMGYDPNGNRTTDTKYLDSGQPASGCSNSPLTETWTYSTDNLQMSDTDAGGNVTSWTRDQVGNATQVMSPSANAGDANNSSRTPTVNTYTEDNLLATTTVPVTPDGSQRRQTTFAYKPFGYKSSQTVNMVNASGGVIASGGTQSYAYYTDERLSTTTGRNGEQITNQYDGAGQPTSIAYSGPGVSSNTVSASYYLNELPISAGEGIPGVSGAGYTYSYDGAGQPAYRATSGYASHSETYSRGDAGQLTSLADANLGTWSFSYDGDGRRTVQNNPNGSHTNLYWGSDGTLQSQNMFDSGPQNNSCSWAYDSLFRLTFSGCNASEPVLSNNTTNWVYYNANDNYGYDNAGRITSFTHGFSFTTGVSGSDTLTFTGSYDHDGNRLAWGSTVSAADTRRNASYNADDSIATETVGISQAHPGGLQTSTYGYAVSGAVTTDGCSSMSYDGFDQLLSAAPVSNNQCGVTTSVSYQYDGLHRQITRTDGMYHLLTAVYHDGLTNNVSMQQDQWLPTVANREEYYALDADGTALGDMFGAMSGGFLKTEFISYDQHRNPIRITNYAALPIWVSMTDPFGAPLNDQPGVKSPQQLSSAESWIGFKGFQQDKVGLSQHLGLRDYQPASGAFAQTDAFVDDPSGASDIRVAFAAPAVRNSRSYGQGDPLNRWDPSGHNLECGFGPDCPELAGTPATDGTAGSLASSAAAERAPGYTGVASQQAYASSPGHATVPLPTIPSNRPPARTRGQAHLEDINQQGVRYNNDTLDKNPSISVNKGPAAYYVTTCAEDRIGHIPVVGFFFGQPDYCQRDGVVLYHRPTHADLDALCESDPFHNCTMTVSGLGPLSGAQPSRELAQSGLFRNALPGASPARIVTGSNFPLQAQPGEVLLKVNPENGAFHSYAVYDQDGRIIKRVDLQGRAHGSYDTPHVQEYDLNVDSEGTIHINKGQVRAATDIELNPIDDLRKIE